MELNQQNMDEMDELMKKAPASEMPEMAPAGPTQGEVPIPLKALAQPDDKDAMTTPEMGDSVTFSVDGTITRIEGEMAYVKANAVNGTPIGEEAEEVAPDEGASLMDEAKGMDQ